MYESDVPGDMDSAESHDPLGRTLESTAALAMSAIGGVDGASVSLAHNGSVATAAATSAAVREADGYQYSSGLGPCVAATKSGQTQRVRVADIAESWPDFAAAATRLGFRSILSTPLVVHGRPLGSLNLYSGDTDAFADQQEQTASLFARQASGVLTLASDLAAAQETNRNLTLALESRQVIGQATGIIMARQGCSADEGFDVLRKASQRENRKLREIAEEIVRANEPKGQHRD